MTLVEVMIVVAILGVLATIAVPMYSNMRQRAKVSEAKANLGAIRVTQYGFYAELSRFVGNQGLTPDRSADPPARLDWDYQTRFSLLGFAPEGRVYFSYALQGADFPTDGFTAEARGDLDDDGAWASWTITSYTKELFHQGSNF